MPATPNPDHIGLPHGLTAALREAVDATPAAESVVTAAWSGAGYRIPWAIPPVGAEEAGAVYRAVAATRLSMGAAVREFEQAVSAYCERRHGIAVSNGTAALEVATRLAGVGPGDEVLVSALSYVATVNCIVRAGARPVWCDVQPGTLNIDPCDAAARITPRTKALIVADYCGFSADYTRLEAACEDHGITLIVDGAQSLGTFHGTRSALKIGRMATTSFHSAKIITTGEGGMVLTDDDDLADRMRRCRGQGEVPGRKYVHDALGFNHRLTDFQGAMGVVQMTKLASLCELRRRHAQAYYSAFSEVPGVTTLVPLSGTTPSWFSMPILVGDRDGLADHLRSAGIETRSLYPIPTYRQPIAEYGGPPSPLPGAEACAARVLNLPIYAQMSPGDIDDVVAHVASFMPAR